MLSLKACGKKSFVYIHRSAIKRLPFERKKRTRIPCIPLIPIHSHILCVRTEAHFAITYRSSDLQSFCPHTRTLHHTTLLAHSQLACTENKYFISRIENESMMKKRATAATATAI